ncbi:MAG TPA: hypothetical protein ENN27_00990 [Candidatus Atribacteria bacterium]|nr:hypothetical protein [Candidatus Atribacteria bacterium]
MEQRIDTRGLSCPLPVVAARKKLLGMKNGVLEVLVDTGTSKDNIVRMVTNMGWKIEVKEEGEEYLLTISK